MRTRFRWDVLVAALLVAVACDPDPDPGSGSGTGSNGGAAPSGGGDGPEGTAGESPGGDGPSPTGAGGEGPGFGPGIVTNTGGEGAIPLGCEPPVLGDRPLTPSCGDGFLDFEEPGYPGEECDDGNVQPDDGCTEECRIEPTRIGGPLAAGAEGGRFLGPGRHPLAGNTCGQVGAVLVDETGATKNVRLALRSTLMPAVGVVTVAPTELTAELARPVVSGTSDGGFVVSWTTWGDDELDVALRKVTLTGEEPELGDVVFANQLTTFSQHSPDLLTVAGGDLVVAWVDDSAETAPDLRYALFDQDLNPLSSEAVLAASDEVESDVALARFGNGWAAAWRAGAGGVERIRVKAGNDQWSVGPFLGGAANESPALVELSDHELLVVFTEGTDPLATGVANVSRLRAALLDTSAPGEVAPFAIEPRLEPYASDDTLAQHSPAIERLDDEVYVAWHSASETNPPANRAEELWLKPILLTEGEGETELDLTLDEAPLPARPKSRSGDQRAPTLLGFELDTEKRLLGAWEDWGKTFGTSAAEPEIQYQVTGLPLFRSDRVTLRVAFGPNTPAGAQVTVTGPGNFEEVVTTGTTFTDVEPGEYNATANTVRVAGARVDTLQAPNLQNSPVTLVPGDTETITAQYERVPGTGMAWVSLWDSRNLLGYDATSMALTGSVTADPDRVLNLAGIATPTATPIAIAFAPDDGRLYAGACSKNFDSPEAIGIYSPSKLTQTSLNILPDVTVTLPTGIEYTCVSNFVLEPNGDLWVSLIYSLLHFTADQLTTSGAPTPHVELFHPTFDQIYDIAFDGAGNLWVANWLGNAVQVIAPSELTTSSSPVTFAKQWAGSNIKGPTGFAFSSTGVLWVANYDGHSISAFDPTSASGNPTPLVEITSADLYQPEMLTFDNAGNLWVTGFGNNKLLRFSPAQLATGGNLTPDAVYTHDLMSAVPYGIRLSPGAN
jgi:cysteine-rich repeat protein